MAEPVLLTGADCFLRAFDGEVRRTSGASHLSQLVLRLGPGLDPERLRDVVRVAAQRAPILRAPIARPYPFAAPVYRLDRAGSAPLPAVEAPSAPPPGGPPTGEGGGIPPVFFERLNERRAMRRGELLRFDHVRRADGGSDLAMTWLHMLFDGAGSEAFVAWLDALSRGDAPLPGGDGLGATAPPPMGAGRGRLARAWQRHMTSYPGPPPRSLAGPLRRERQRLRYELTSFSAAESEVITARASALAGFLTPMLFYLAASVRAHRAVFLARGVDPGSYVVPLPVNLRPKGAEGAIFRSHVSMLWFRVAAAEAASLEGLVAALKVQRRDAIKAGLVEAGVAAMDYARHAPGRLYAHMARRHFRGELCSFFFAYTDRFLPGLHRFLGAPIENGFHAPSVPPSPGSSVILSLRGERLNLTHVHQLGVFAAGEREVFHEALLGDLLGRSP